MSDTADSQKPGAPSALFVTTVPITLEAFLLPFADHFRAQGWRVDAMSNGAAEDPRIASHFDERFDVAWSRNPLSSGNLLGTSSIVRRTVAAGGYDIVHVHTPIAAFVTRYALRTAHRLAGGPTVIYTAHGFHFYEGQPAAPNALFRTMERVAASWTDYLVTINRQDFDAARALGGILPAHVRYIPGIGVDVDRFAPGSVPAPEIGRVRAELGVTNHTFLLVMVAEFGEVKRHWLALKALSHVRNAHVHLALVGDGPLEAATIALVGELELGDRVTFAGYRRDLPAVLAASDALLLTSEREGLNRSVLEAMASGKPVVGTNTRGIADAVGAEAGWITPHDDEVALAHAIDEAAADPAECARRGAAALERARAEFALDRIVTEYEELYLEALASRV